MRLDDLPAPSRRFVVGVSASVATVYSSPSRGWASRAADTDFAPFFAVSTAVTEYSAEASVTTTSVVQPTHSRSSLRGTDSVEPAGPTAYVSYPPGFPAPQTMTQSLNRNSTRTRRPSARAAGKAPLLSTMASVPAGPLDHIPSELQPRHGSHGQFGTTRTLRMLERFNGGLARMCAFDRGFATG